MGKHEQNVEFQKNKRICKSKVREDPSFPDFKIQFNSDICTRQLMNITLAHTAKKKAIDNITIIKYMNEKRKKNQSTMKKWDFSFVLKEWSENVNIN